MRIYEELFIVKPDASEEEIDGLVGQFQSVVGTAGGAVEKVEKWGVRKLAYSVQKKHEGYFVLLQFRTAPETVRELERRLRVSDLVLKFLTVRIDQKLKKLDKRKKIREKRAQRRPAAPAAAPGPPVPGPLAPEAAPVPGEPQ